MQSVNHKQKFGLGLISLWILLTSGCANTPSAEQQLALRLDKLEQRVERLDQQQQQLIEMAPQLQHLIDIEQDLRIITTELAKLDDDLSTNPIATQQPQAAIVQIPAAPMPVPAAPSANSGPYTLQLISTQKQPLTRSHWQSVAAANLPELAGLSPKFERVVLKQGTFFRLKIGAFDSRKASQTCDALKRANFDCVVVPR